MSDSSPADLLARVEEADFGAWYRERKRRENAREDRFERNGPRDPPTAELHFPSSLLQCHRKRRYVEENAPPEQPSPDGRFWVGSAVETELIHPFLEERVAGPTEYVTYGKGFSVEVATDDRTFRLQGRTDPVITNESGTALLPTEVKTKDSLDWVEEPSEHHRAQVHAYLYALDEQSPRPVEDALLVYVSAETFEVRTFQVTFDDAFWRERVVPWMVSQTAAREADELPPGTPEQGWECSYCSFRHRCGKTDHPASDSPPVGFLPNRRYPRAAVENHLEAHDATLTPTVAAQYPDLARAEPVEDWYCPVCGQRVAFGAFDWSGALAERPPCPQCELEGYNVPMTAPLPDEVPIEGV